MTQQRNNTPDPLAVAREWQAAGVIHVSPAQLGAVLHCDGEALRVTAKQGRSAISCFFSGRNCRFLVSSVIDFLCRGGAAKPWEVQTG